MLFRSVQIADLFDNFGNPIDIPIQLNPGLYSITFQFEDGSFFRVIEEKERETYNPATMANYLSVTIFPVPILENEFNMNLNATQSMDFEYSLHDFNGGILYQTRVYINEGEAENIRVRVENGIPKGFLINKFSFPDGSYLSIITVKSE